VRKSLSFSNSEWFHQVAIKYFIAHYNQERQKIYLPPFVFSVLFCG